MSDLSFELTFNDETTVHELAEQIRDAAFKRVGQAEFSQLLLFVDQLVQGEVEKVLAILRRNSPTTNDYHLALCWLDGKGFGSSRYVELETALEKMRGRVISKQPPPSLN